VATPNAQKPEIARFVGKSRADVKRKALNYWYLNRGQLGLDLRAFSARCRMLDNERTIVFYDP